MVTLQEHEEVAEGRKCHFSHVDEQQREQKCDILLICVLKQPIKVADLKWFSKRERAVEKSSVSGV